MALKHKLLAQYKPLTDLRQNYALVETESDFVVASGYNGHGKEWGQGYYFPKSKGENQAETLKNVEARQQAYIAFTSIVEADRLTLLNNK